MNLRKVMRTLSGALPSVRSERRLRRVQDMVMRIDHLGLGSSATYVGDNRVLVRIIAGIHVFILYVHADDKLISPWLIVNGVYERDVTDYLVSALRVDSHCVDVGANLGYFTCLMAKYATRGRVIAFEPNGYVHALTQDNVLINALHERSEILNVAVSDVAGEITLYHRIGRSGNTSFVACGDAFTRELREPPEQPFQVPTVRIDDLRDRLGGRVDFLKIDVEGAEPLVLRGARETIAANPQIQIIMEWAPAQMQAAGFEIERFAEEIFGLGLRPSAISRGPLRSISADELKGLAYQPAVLLRRLS